MVIEHIQIGLFFLATHCSLTAFFCVASQLRQPILTSIFAGFGVIPWLLLGLIHWFESEIIQLQKQYKMVSILSHEINDLVALLASYSYIPVYISFWIFLHRFIYVRFIKPHLHEFSFKWLKKGFLARDIRKLDLAFKSYSGWPFVANEQGFFWGKFHQSKETFYLPFKRLCKHIQVEGPSGAGKTESVLKPLAFQSLSQRIPLVFVDGKADAQLAKECFYFSQTKEIPFYIFNTLEITEKDHSYDTSKTSHTFNPLLFSNDPAKLTDALVLSLNLQSSSDAKFYLDAQKAFLLQLFNVFLATNKGFTFIDIVEFMKYQDTRAYVFDCATKLGNKHAVDDMKVLLESFDKNLTQLLGLRNILEQLFVSDTVISKLINVYDPVINIHDILTKKQAVLFSLSAGDRFQSNMALAKMIVSILNSLVGSKQGYSEKEDWMIILDEFGQFSTDAIKPLITTARSTNTAIALSYQSKEQLMNVEGLADIVNTNCDTKCIFKSPDQADEWAKLGGTVESIKRTDVIEDDAFATESREGRASLRQVDEFQIEPNVFRKLNTGQSVTKFTDDKGSMQLAVIDHGLFDYDVDSYPQFENSFSQESGLALKEKRLAGLISASVKKKYTPEDTVQKVTQVEEKIYLSVGYQERTKAKEAGALWDSKAKKWYTTTLTEPLKQWVKTG